MKSESSRPSALLAAGLFALLLASAVFGVPACARAATTGRSVTAAAHRSLFDNRVLWILPMLLGNSRPSEPTRG